MTARLALDLGTQTGWCLLNKPLRGGFSFVSGTESFKSDRYSGGGMRYLKFRQWLDGVYAASPFDSVHFEEVRRHRGTDAAHVYGGLLGILTAWCEEREIPYEGVPVGTIKRFWTGKGNAGKPEMLAECAERGFKPQDDNEADAIALAHWVAEEISG